MDIKMCFCRFIQVFFAIRTMAFDWNTIIQSGEIISKGSEGETVTFYCPFNCTNNFPTWSRRGFPLAAGTNINSAASQKGRMSVYINCDEQTVNLVISNVTSNDEDTYCCDFISINLPFQHCIFLKFTETSTSGDNYYIFTDEKLNTDSPFSGDNKLFTDENFKKETFLYVMQAVTFFLVILVLITCHVYKYRRSRSSELTRDDNTQPTNRLDEHQNVEHILASNQSNMQQEIDNSSSHYETINDNEMLSLHELRNVSEPVIADEDVITQEATNITSPQRSFSWQQEALNEVAQSGQSTTLNTETSTDNSSSDKIEKSAKKENTYPHLYLSLEINDMEYLNSYSAIQKQQNQVKI